MPSAIESYPVPGIVTVGEVQLAMLLMWILGEFQWCVDEGEHCNRSTTTPTSSWYSGLNESLGVIMYCLTLIYLKIHYVSSIWCTCVFSYNNNNNNNRIHIVTCNMPNSYGREWCVDIFQVFTELLLCTIQLNSIVFQDTNLMQENHQECGSGLQNVCRHSDSHWKAMMFFNIWMLPFCTCTLCKFAKYIDLNCSKTYFASPFISYMVQH